MASNPDSASDELLTLSSSVRDALEAQLAGRINTNAVDGPKDVLLAVEIASMVDSAELIENSLRKMLRFLTLHDGSLYVPEMHNLATLSKAWQVADRYVRSRH